MPVLERQKTATRARLTSPPRTIATPIRAPYSPSKGPGMVIAFLGLVSVATVITLLPTFQPQVKVPPTLKAQQGVIRPRPLNITSGYHEEAMNLKGGRANEYTASTMKVGSVSQLTSKPKVKAVAPVAPNPIQALPVAPSVTPPVTPSPIAPVPITGALIAPTPDKPVPIAPRIIPPPPSQIGNPFEGFMSAMSNSINKGAQTVGTMGNAGLTLAGNVAGAGVNITNASLSTGSRVASNVGNSLGNAINTVPQDLGNFNVTNPSNNPAPTPQLDGGGGNGGNGGGGDGNGPNSGDGGSGIGSGNSSDLGGPSPNMSSESNPDNGGGDEVSSSGPCGKVEPPPCAKPSSPCGQGTSYQPNSFIKKR